MLPPVCRHLRRNCARRARAAMASCGFAAPVRPGAMAPSSCAAYSTIGRGASATKSGRWCPGWDGPMIPDPRSRMLRRWRMSGVRRRTVFYHQRTIISVCYYEYDFSFFPRPFLSLCLSVRLSICLSVCLSLCPFSLPVPTCPPVVPITYPYLSVQFVVAHPN